MKDLFRIISHRLMKNKKQSVSALAIIITFVMVYSLIMPAVAIERDAAEKEPGLTIEESASENVAAEAMAEAEPASLEAEVSDEAAAAEEAVVEEPAAEEPAAEEIEAETAPAAAPAQNAADDSNVAADTSAAQGANGGAAQQGANVDAASADTGATQANTGAAQSDENKANADGKADASDSDTKASDAEEEMPAQKFEQVIKYKEIIDEDGNTVEKQIKVTVDAAKNTFPADTTMKAELILDNADIEKAVEDAVKQAAVELADATSIVQYRAVDITFADKDGRKIEPAKKVEVRITSDKIVEIVNPMLVHVNVNDQNGRVINADVFPKKDVSIVDEHPDTIADNENTMVFKASRFSPYVIVESQTIDEDGDAMHGLNGVEENADNGAESDDGTDGAASGDGKSGNTVSADGSGVLIAESDSYKVTIKYEENANIPEDAEIEINEIPEASRQYQSYKSEAEELLTGDENKNEENGENASGSTVINYAKIVDVNIVSASEGTVTPEADVDVDIAYKETEEITEGTVMQALSFNGRTPAVEEDALVYGGKTYVDGMQVTTDKLPVYGIVGTETISTQFITADGKTLSVTATFDARELLPKDAVLEVSEVTYEDDPDVYAKRNERLAEALFKKYGNVAITDARYLDISVMVPDESVGGDAKKEYEPVYPVKVKVDYTETMDTTNPGEYKDYNDGSTKVTPDIGNHIVGVHYTEDGAEFLETVDESTNTGVSETVTKTDSFSEYDFAYIYEYEIVDTDYDYEPSQISTMTLNTGMSTKAAGSGMLRAAGDTPAHTKTLSNNHDGTHKLSLTVTGDADTDSNTASNANVIIVFDTSNSMINYYVPMANGARGSNNADGSNSFVLYRNTSGTEADDGYSGTVYYRYRDGNRYRYSEYTGQRYSKTIRRADAAEKVLYDFAHALYGYQNDDDPATTDVDESKNIQTALITFNKTATTTQGWTSTETDITNKVSSTGAGGSKKIANSSGTNWEDALRAAQTMVNSADNDPTFVVFITDGQPTQWHDYTSGYDTTGEGYVQSRDEARALQLACAATGTDSHGALFGIYAYGTEADYLDELMYYAYTGTARDMDPGTVATDGYYNAADSSSLADAINDIFSKIVKTLGITGVSVNDGTTSQVQTTSGEISHLLEVDTSTYEYWLSFNTVDGKFTMKDLLSGNDIEYTVTSSGNNVTISWSKDGNNYSETYEGTYSAGTARIKWDRATSFYNYAPPTASFTNPSVDWDLSTVGTLLDGVTYEVTFDVYPSQYTLDLVAQMKNGEVEYADLDPNVKKYLKEDYTLHTNTEANLTYTDSRNGEGEQTVPYVNPEPVSTNSEQLTINKVWEGGDPDTDSLPITVMMGGEEFHTSTLSAANGWKTNATISIGIIKNGQALSGAMGHDFSFAELDDTQYHWELDAPTVRPMLVNGTLTMLIKADAKHPVPSGATTYTIDGSTYYVDSSTTGLTATNIRRSYLDVVKTVTGANAPADAVFDFTMKVVNSRASTAGDPENLDSDYYVWFSVADSNNGYAFVIDDNLVSGNVTRATDGTGAYTGYYYMPSGTEIHVNMKAGYSLRFLNLPSGSSYEVAESTTMPDESFSFVSITGDGTVDPDNNQKMTGTIVTANNGYRVSVANKYTAVDVQLKKVDDKDQLLSGAIFTLTKQQGTAWGNIQEDIKPGDTESGTANPVDLGGLGVGKYRLTETKSPDGYIKLTSHIDFEVYKDGTVLAVKLAEGATGAKIEKSGTEDAPVYTVIVENTPGEALPNTGGPGTLPYTLGGIALIMASALMYGFRMRRRERRLN